MREVGGLHEQPAWKNTRGSHTCSEEGKQSRQDAQLACERVSTGRAWPRAQGGHGKTLHQKDGDTPDAAKQPPHRLS